VPGVVLAVPASAPLGGARSQAWPQRQRRGLLDKTAWAKMARLDFGRFGNFGLRETWSLGNLRHLLKNKHESWESLGTFGLADFQPDRCQPDRFGRNARDRGNRLLQLPAKLKASFFTLVVHNLGSYHIQR